MLELQHAIGNQAVLQLFRLGAIQAKLAANLPGDMYEQKADGAAEKAVSSAAPLLMQRKCACGGTPGPTGECEECSKKNQLGLQTKLRVNEQGDIYEKEADRIADQVLAGPAHSGVSAAPPRIQRFSGQSNGQMHAAPASVDHALASPGKPLEPALRQDMEQRFGYDFSQVQVHSGAAAQQSAGEVNASAYTVGHNIVFGDGRFAPETHEGRHLIAHELTHVVQQSGSNRYLARQTAGSSRTPNVPSPELTKSSTEQRRLEPLRVIAQEFRAKVDADPASVSPGRNITDIGQNFWTGQIMDKIEDFVLLWISEPLQNDFISLTHAIVEPDNSKAADLRKKITQNPVFKTDIKAQKLLNTDPDPRTGRELYEEWWSTYRTKKTFPSWAKYRTIPILTKIHLWEVVACGYTVSQVVDVQKSRGGTGKGTRNPKNAILGEQLFASPTAARDPCRVTPTSALGDLVKYKSLQSVVDKMKIALDDGFEIYTHVLSGYGVGSQAPMTGCSDPEQRAKSQTQVTIAGEHYILIIGYENNKFLFWDAHASDSQEFGGGFGFLFFDSSNNRLTTAEHDANLPVDTNGGQNNGQHRYQPLTMSTR